MTLAINLIAALTATFRADAQDLLTTVKHLAHTFDAADDIPTQDAIYLAIHAIRREVQERIDHEDDELHFDPTFERDLLLRDVLACINEFFD